MVVAGSVITTKDTAAKATTVEFLFENFITTDHYNPSIRKYGDNYRPEYPFSGCGTMGPFTREGLGGKAFSWIAAFVIDMTKDKGIGVPPD